MSKKPKTQKQNFEEIGRMVANIYESGYINKNQTYKMSFIKGLLSGVGGVLGATIVIALLLWLLSFFSSIPLIGPFTEKATETIQQSQ